MSYGRAAGARRAWPAWLLAVFCFVLAVPALADLERLFVGLGVLALLVAVLITTFSARSPTA